MCTMAEDRGLIADPHYTELTCGTENLSPFSAASGYNEQSYYSTHPHEYDWQQQPQHQQSQHTSILQQPTHHQLIEASDKHFYNTFQDGTGTQCDTHNSYTGYMHPHTQDFYSPNGHNTVIWSAPPTTSISSTTSTSANSPDAAMMGQHPHHHRFFSGIDLGQHPGAHHPLHPHISIHPGGTPSQPTAPAKPKRKRVQSHSQRKAANVRERRRMFHLNEAFDELRKRLPAFNYEKRLSRIETLRLAMTYISFMKDVSVGEDPKSVKLKAHGAELSPPDGSRLTLGYFFSGSGSSNDERSILNDDSDDEISNHSGGN